ncbi:MAG: lipid-A-disaccharide synthase [candidate division NC10 bacterium]|nr:lipid-A-disaccharide synthase [candidate division NC10 bacterium]MBI4842584.1 lipid-A-disaccharide synthase [candidate division NC10 bacterium]
MHGSPAGPRILIVAGEASGDLHGARLVAALRRLAPELTLEGMGGGQMRDAGVHLLADAGDTAVVGLTELWEKRRALRDALRRLRQHLATARPALLICIDFPDFNLLLARTARRLRIPVCYFISPQVWAWRRGRIRTIRRLVRKMLVLFPFEEAMYQKAGVDVTFVGHPLLDALADVPPREACRAALGVASPCPVLGLLPGSREAEIRRHLPLLLGAAARLAGGRPDLRLLLGLAPSLDDRAVEAAVAASGIRPTIIQGRTPELIRAADLVLAVSGTVTLEAAILGTPMVITYRVGTLSWALGRLLVRVRFIGLPNLVADEGIVPELIQFAATPERLALTAAAILESPERQARMRAALAEVRTRLGAPGAAERAAREVLALLPAS